MRTKIVFLTASFLFATSAVQAQAPAATGFYGGLGMGSARARLDNSDFTFASPFISESQNNSDTGYKFFGGYRINRYIGAELSYTDFGKFSYDYDLSSVGLGTARVGYKANSWALSALGTFPVAGGFSLLGRLGVTSNSAKRSAIEGDAPTANLLSPFPAAKSRKTSALWGVGGQFDFTPVVGLRLEFENYGKFGAANPGVTETGRATIRMTSVSLIAHF
jgi:OOP family OmpA-OmpF porin